MEELIKKALTDLNEALTDNAMLYQTNYEGICTATVTAYDKESDTEVYIDAVAYYEKPRILEEETRDRPALWSDMVISQPVITDALAIIEDVEYNIQHLVKL
jgi:hypothetical protein